MTREEKIERLKSMGHTLWYADRNGLTYQTAGLLSRYPTEGEPFIVVDNVRGEDSFGQTATYERSNFRILTAEDDNHWTVVSYVNQDGLGAFVDDLDENDLNTLDFLADYPILDESDWSELESEEIFDSYLQYLESDTVREIGKASLGTDTEEKLFDWLTTVPEETRQQQFFTEMSALDYYPEHDGLDVLWDSEVVESIVRKISGIGGE